MLLISFSGMDKGHISVSVATFTCNCVHMALFNKSKVSYGQKLESHAS